MTIDATNPTVIPQQPQKTYNVYWLTDFGIIADSPTQPIRVRATLQKARVLDNGSYELSPLSSDKVIVIIKDFFAAAAKNPALLQVEGTLLDAIQAEAKAQNLI